MTQEQKGKCTSISCTKGLSGEEQLMSTNNGLCEECNDKLEEIVIVNPDPTLLEKIIKNLKWIGLGILCFLVIVVLICSLTGLCSSGGTDPDPNPDPDPDLTSTTKFCCTDGIRRTSKEIKKGDYEKAENDKECCLKDCETANDNQRVCDRNGKIYRSRCIAECYNAIDISEDCTGGNINPSIFDEAKKEVRQKIKMLEQYSQTITDREESDSNIQNAIEQAADLFMDDAQISVSSLSKEDIISRPVLEYLNHIKNLYYTDITIEWIEIGEVSDFARSADNSNTYEATISVKQKFVGYTDSNQTKPKYQDITVKNYIIRLELEETNTGTQSKILLGDASVKSTSPVEE